MKVELLTTADCPHVPEAERRVTEVLARLAPGSTLTRRTITTAAEVRAEAFPGSPTVRVDGADLEGAGAPATGLACRRYGREGVPPTWLIEAAVLRARGVEDVLFLCVANSARSQLAEGLARAMAPGHVRVRSAGSEPTSVRPLAVRAMAEIGIDISSQRSKSVDDLEDGAGVVITLCAEEACPVWLDAGARVRWTLPDPAGGEGSEEERLQAFRDVRDELRRRLGVLFGAGDGVPA